MTFNFALAIAHAEQLAFIAADTGAAIGALETNLQIGPWSTRESVLIEQSTGRQIQLRASFARAGRRMFEIVQPLSADGPFTEDLRGAGGQVCVPHHVGAFSQSSAAVLRAAAGAGCDCYSFRVPAGEVVFVDTRKFCGLWFEALCFSPAAAGL